MTKLNVNEAKERLPELLDEGAKGEEIVITKGNGASYKITVEALEPTKHIQRIANLHPGSFIMSDDFDEELPDSFWLGEE